MPETEKIIYSPPPDKSITLRALVFSAIAGGESVIENPLICGDTLAAVKALRKLGVKLSVSAKRIKVRGAGPRGLGKASSISAGESAAFMRLFSPILACQPARGRGARPGPARGRGARPGPARPGKYPFLFKAEKTLLKRSMRELVEKLSLAGAVLRAGNSRPPLKIFPSKIKGGLFRASSAQIKSALLAAGLYSDKPLRVLEEIPSRDHTERLLRFMGASIKRKGRTVSIERSALKGAKIRVPGDISACAPFITAAFLMKKELLINNCGINPTRTGFIKALKRMGFRVSLKIKRGKPEDSGDIIVFPPLKIRPVRTTEKELPSMIDEIHFLAFLAAFARGESSFRGVSALKNKESDRLKKICETLKRAGASCHFAGGELRVSGGSSLKKLASLKTLGDHRIAMLGAVLSLLNPQIEIDDAACVKKSYPGFWRDFRRFVPMVKRKI